jgi:hypothetical protein
MLVMKTRPSVALLALAPPLLTLAHVCAKRFQSKSRSQAAKTCLSCRADITWFRRLSHHRFCSEEHQMQWLAEFEELAIERLQLAHNALVGTGTHRKTPVHQESYSKRMELVLVNR